MLQTNLYLYFGSLEKFFRLDQFFELKFCIIYLLLLFLYFLYEIFVKKWEYLRPKFLMAANKFCNSKTLRDKWSAIKSGRRVMHAILEKKWQQRDFKELARKKIWIKDYMLNKPYGKERVCFYICMILLSYFLFFIIPIFYFACVLPFWLLRAEAVVLIAFFAFLHADLTAEDESNVRYFVMEHLVYVALCRDLNFSAWNLYKTDKATLDKEVHLFGSILVMVENTIFTSIFFLPFFTALAYGIQFLQTPEKMYTNFELIKVWLG